ncbi:MAG: penicillin-binding protein, partial [Candidatus Binataceae bacterium]
TGTTNDSKDAWFAGFTPNLLAVVWTGFDQKETLGLTGAQASLPAWTAFMQAAAASWPAIDFAVPPGIVVENVDPMTGYRAGPFCPITAPGVFPVALAPTQYCPFHNSTTAHPAADHNGLPAPQREADPVH